MGCGLRNFMCALALLALPVFSVIAKDKENILVQHVCRHGDRAPTGVFPNYEHKDFWVQGLGYLSPIGMNETYFNGKAWRQYYPGLISDTVLPSELIVYSSHIDRTIMSADATMAGFYPPTEEYKFQPGLDWQAYPVHSLSPSIDYYLFGVTCPALDLAIFELHETEAYKQFLAENQNFTDLLCGLAGYERYDWDMDCIGTVSDVFICNEAHGLSQPDWSTPEMITRSINIRNQFRTFRYTDQNITKLDTGGGPLLAWMLSNIAQKIADNLSYKLVFFSAHDSTWLPFMGNLGWPVGPNPPYASCAMLQLNQYKDGLYAELFYKNSTLGFDLIPFSIEGCEDKCPLDKFLKLAAPRSTPDPEAACWGTSDGKYRLKK